MNDYESIYTLLAKLERMKGGSGETISVPKAIYVLAEALAPLCKAALPKLEFDPRWPSIVKNVRQITERRECKTCGKPHNSGIDNRETGEFTPIEECVDCLMGKCGFQPLEGPIVLSDDVNMSIAEMQRKLGETECKVLQAEYGSVGNVNFADARLCNADGEEILCKCGKPSGMAIIGRESYVARCNECMEKANNGISD